MVINENAPYVMLLLIIQQKNLSKLAVKKYLFSCQIWFGTFKKSIFQAKKNVCVGGVFGPEIWFS